MRLIRKKPIPSSFQNYRQQSNATFENLDKIVKEDLRTALIAEQHGLCAYCQQILREGKIKIEHHCERSICNGENNTQDRRLDYTNLFAVCMGKGGQEKELHCDTKKATFKINNGLPMTICPTNQSHINTLKYSRTGLIKSNMLIAEVEINKFLNLNAKHLREARKKKWLQIFSNSKSKSGNTNRKKMSKLIEVDLALKEDKFITPFPAMLEFMKTKFC